MQQRLISALYRRRLKDKASCIIVFYLMLSIPSPLIAQSSDYLKYYDYVNLAEIHFFNNNNADSAFYYYDKILLEYDFVFVKDMVNAAQLALYSEKPYKKYLVRGFRYGLKLNHLEQIPIFGSGCELDSILYLDKELNKIYGKERQTYLQNIDTNYLNWIYDLALQDQVDKLLPRVDYNRAIEKNIKKLEQLILIKGFPSNKLIGIEDRTIFKEMGMPNLDFNIRKEQAKFAKARHYDAENKLLGSKYTLVFLVHHHCALVKIGNILIEEMSKGNIHPREIGLLYDNMYRFDLKKYPNKYCTAEGALNGVYKLNPFLNYSNISYSEEEINQKRKELHIVPLDVDVAKMKFQKREGCILFWGFWNCL